MQWSAPKTDRAGSRRLACQRFALLRPRLVLATMLAAAAAQAGPIAVSIDARATAAPVTPYEYGMFIEPIGNLIGRSLWAEMLDDALDRPVLSARIPTFEYDEHLVAVLDDVPLHFDKLDL